jgi:MscS family membrane protein
VPAGVRVFVTFARLRWDNYGCEQTAPVVSSTAMRARLPFAAVTLGLAFDRGAVATFFCKLTNARQPRVRTRPIHRLGALMLASMALTIASAQSQVYPLEPPDRSSPRAALQTFLDSGDALATFMAQEYLPSPSSAKFNRAIELSVIPVEGLDLSELPPAARLKGGRAAALSLYEVLSRIQLPPADQIPGVQELTPPSASGAMHWVIPHTEIALVRIPNGPRTGEFLFSADTVARANSFYERVRDRPYTRRVPVASVRELFVGGGGWMIPNRWIRAMPAWLHKPVAEQPRWKWIGFVLVLAAFMAAFMLLGRMANRVSRVRGQRSPFLDALAQLAVPGLILAATPVVAYLVQVQLNLIGDVGIAVGDTLTVIMFLAGAWFAWRLAPAVAEAIIASPSIASDSVHAHLIRVSARLLAIVGSASFLAMGADRLGVPVYGIVAGLGVGGLAVALAAQPTTENLIGGLNLFADHPIRVGDFCKYGDKVGTVEAIGMRSTRIRNPDRTLTTIPNAELAKIPIVNFSLRDRVLIQTVIGLRCETKPEQVRQVLLHLRELLLRHPRIDRDTVRVRLIGFESSSFKVELFAYVTTRDWEEFLGIREDILLQVMEVIDQGGATLTG